MSDAPKWGRWTNDREQAVICLTCKCTYQPRFWSDYAGKDGKGGMIGGIPKACTSCARARAEAKRKALPLDLVLVEAVKTHALAHYSEGWDYVVETYADTEIWEVIAGTKTEASAIRRMEGLVKLLRERREDIRSTIW